MSHIGRRSWSLVSSQYSVPLGEIPANFQPRDKKSLKSAEISHSDTHAKDDTKSTYQLIIKITVSEKYKK